MASQNYVLLERIELNASAASVTFSNIPQTGYTDLKIVCSVRAATGAVQYVNLSFNGSTSSFTSRGLEGDGASAYSYTSTFLGGVFDASTYTANTFANNEIYIPNYTSSNYKSYSVDSVTENNATTSFANMLAGLWSNTAAINSITMVLGSGASFAVGCTFSLYGIANASTTPAIAPKASGGNVIATDGTYWYHAFLSNGTFTPQINLTADILQVAGGGSGGGSYSGGGGGAGGLLVFTAQSLTTNTNYTCTIGAGGAGGSRAYQSNNTNSGSNSQFASLTASVGGGAGGVVTTYVAGKNGGSGGGAGGEPTGAIGGTGTSGQGNNGGNGNNTGSNGLGGGGGGAGGGGSSASGSTAGAGGIGVNTYASWLTPTNLGVSGYLAGGGGGGAETGTGGAGGAGGGGNGAKGSGSDAIANTGGGGGSGGGTTPTYGGNGGSGVIIIRYPVA